MGMAIRPSVFSAAMPKTSINQPAQLKFGPRGGLGTPQGEAITPIYQMGLPGADVAPVTGMGLLQQSAAAGGTLSVEQILSSYRTQNSYSVMGAPSLFKLI